MWFRSVDQVSVKIVAQKCRSENVSLRNVAQKCRSEKVWFRSVDQVYRVLARAGKSRLCSTSLVRKVQVSSSSWKIATL